MYRKTINNFAIEEIKQQLTKDNENVKTGSLQDDQLNAAQSN